MAQVVTCGAVYAFARRDLGAVAGSVAVLMLLVSRLNHGFSVEARAYATMLMFLAVAALAWQRAADRQWSIVFAISLALSIGTHCCATFAAVAFVGAEIGLAIRAGRIRPLVWFGFVLAAAVLAGLWWLLASLRDYYGASYFSKPTLGKAMHAYDWAFFASLPGAGFGTALALGLAIGWLAVRLWPREEDLHAQCPAPETLTLVILILATPFTTSVSTRLMGGGFAEHCILGVIVGIGLSTAYAVRALDQRKQSLTALGLALVFASQELVLWASGGRFNGRYATSHVEEQQRWLAAVAPLRLPVVIDSGLDYLPLALYGDGSVFYLAGSRGLPEICRD